MQAVVPRPDVAPLLNAGFVALAADADLPEAPVHQLMFKLKGAMMLPFVLIAEPDGSFVDGFAGAVEPERLIALLESSSGAGGSS